MEEAERTVLEAFLLRNPELEQLEALLSQFNIFDSLRIVQQEIRHSDFLGFLLDPQQNHGLREIFIRRFLQLAIASSQHQGQSISVIEIESLDLSGAEILREWSGIDILIRDETNQLVVIIENKIATTEHSNQLERYWNLASEVFKGWRKVGLYLTPDGDEPNNQNYLTIEYELICSLLEDILGNRAPNINLDVRMFISHYTQMLRRHILSESEIAKLCASIYKKHRAALDLIYEHRPDLQAALKEFLNELIDETGDVIFDSGSKAYVHFVPKTWEFAELRQGAGWTPTGRILLFEFQNFKDSLKLRLYIGPGPKELRDKLFQMARGGGSPFKISTRELGQKWHTIFDRPFLSPKDYREIAVEDLKTKIRNSWNFFLSSDLPKLSVVIEKRRWLET